MLVNSLPLSTILNVAVVVSPAAAPGPSFNQGLIVGPSDTISSSERLRLYSYGTEGMIQDGFSSTDPEVKAAEKYFGQTPKPTYLWIGRQDLTAIATAVVGSAAGTGYAVGDVVTVVQTGASDGKLKVKTVGTGGAVTAVEIIEGSQGTGYSISSGLTTTGGSGDAELTVNITAIGETPLQAVQACRLAQPNWYACMFVGNATDSEHQAISAFIESASPASLYFLTTGEASVLNTPATNLLAALQAEKYRRTFSMYATDQGGLFPDNAYASAAPKGKAMGMNTGAAGSYFDIMFKPIAGVAPEPLTQSQVNAICGPIDRSTPGLNANVMLSYLNESYSWIQPGIMASGDFFDEVLNLDMLASDMQISGVNLLTSVPALPITDGGVTMMKNVLAAACDRAKARGFIAPSGIWQGPAIGTGAAAIEPGDALPNGYYLYAPAVSTVPAAKRAARVMPAIIALVIEAQSGHSLSVTLEVQR
jgi:hypothetical protein